MYLRYVATLLQITFFLVAANPATALDPQDIAKALDPSVVRIFVIGPNRAATGTGFVINNEGYIATNFHVIKPHLEHGWQVFVLESGADPKHRRAVTLVKPFPGEDVAILRVDGLSRPPVQLSEVEDKLAKGTPVFAIGFPGAGDRLGPLQEASFASGTVSRLFPGSWADAAPKLSIIQHTAPTNPGSSGGPLVDACGNVVGINSQREVGLLVTASGVALVTDPIQGVFFSSHVSVLLEKLKRLDIRFTATQKACRTFLGIASTNLDLYIAAVALLGIAGVASLFVFRPRPIVQIVVHCTELVEDCVNAVERAIKKVKSNVGNITYLAAGSEKQVTPTPVWVFSGFNGDGEPVELTISDAELRLAEDGLVIGSDPAVTDKVLSGPTISRRHVRLVVLTDGIGIVDLHSDGRTFVDGTRLAPNGAATPIHAGSQVTLGDVALKVTRTLETKVG